MCVMFIKLFPTYFWLYFSYVVTFLLPLVYGFVLFCVRDHQVRKENGIHPRRVLSVVLLILGVLLIQAMLQDFYVFYTYQSLNNVPFSMNFGLALSPLLYLYFRKLMLPEKLGRRRLFVHLLPVSLVVIFEIVIIALHYTGNLSPAVMLIANAYAFIYPVPLVLSAVFYLFYIVQFRKSYLKNINENYSFIEGIDLNWVNTMIILYVLLLAVIVPSFLIKIIWLRHFSNIVLVVFASYLFIRSLREPHIYYKSSFNVRVRDGFNHAFVKSESIESPPGFASKTIGEKQDILFAGSSPESSENIGLPLQIARKAELKNKLLSLFEDQRVYLKSTLTLNEVAQMLHTNRTYISNIVNSEFSLSFYQFVNKYRIDEATRLFIANPEIQSNRVAEMVGFNSISSFIIAFKLHKKCTPKEWRQANEDSCVEESA